MKNAKTALNKLNNSNMLTVMVEIYLKKIVE